MAIRRLLSPYAMSCKCSLAALNKTSVRSFTYRRETMNTDLANAPAVARRKVHDMIIGEFSRHHPLQEWRADLLARPDAMTIQPAIAMISAYLAPKGRMRPSRHIWTIPSRPRNKEGSAIGNGSSRNAYLKQTLYYSRTERTVDVIISGLAR